MAGSPDRSRPAAAGDGGKPRAGRNRTLVLTPADRRRLAGRLIRKVPRAPLASPPQGTICGDCMRWAPLLPPSCVDLLFLDPPYNMDKRFNGTRYPRRDVDRYTEWLDGVLTAFLPLLKDTATVYICGDWLTAHSAYAVASSHLTVRNRITWEREKGRGTRRNWKNACEDIWFCTAGDRYTFNVDAVKLRRRVRAPYTFPDGSPKDWARTGEGNFRDTHPGNLWTDLTVPFWSMPENTDHPAQKSEKLLARLLLASTNPGDLVLDPFLGSGTSSAVARKLSRRCLGIEIEEEYCLLAERRLELAAVDPGIQGFDGRVFRERNSFPPVRRRG